MTVEGKATASTTDEPDVDALASYYGGQIKQRDTQIMDLRLEVARLRAVVLRCNRPMIAAHGDDWPDIFPTLQADAARRALRVGNGSSSELDPAPDGRCPCGGALTPDGVCPDRCARDTWETGR